MKNNYSGQAREILVTDYCDGTILGNFTVMHAFHSSRIKSDENDMTYCFKGVALLWFPNFWIKTVMI